MDFFCMKSMKVAYLADIGNPNTVIIFYLSGIVACETLLWILIAQLFWFFLVNFLVLLILKFLFSHFLIQLLLPYFNRITQLLPGTPPNSSDMPNTEQQQHDSQVLSGFMEFFEGQRRNDTIAASDYQSLLFVLGDCKESHDIYSFIWLLTRNEESIVFQVFGSYSKVCIISGLVWFHGIV
ncbi:uncharacterized protein LOC106775561 [Vigna radiata var. radiata]|uniref:Uncharacterized protein LOC106775561 n=1 Tax=Vigna radiata var. radiata TaxID=3916 RepID=A0A3Q0FFW8_VIGRR|nr:uncharacterized protein LOC106775561 [Vigna radiata var. radiata]